MNDNVIGLILGENEETRSLEHWHEDHDLLLRLNYWRPEDEARQRSIEWADVMVEIHRKDGD